jgi:ornithine carbamoyltransferase
MKQTRHFLRITDLTVVELKQVLKISSELKKELKKKGRNRPIFLQKTLAMIYEKPSLRTRVSFEVGATQLGGHAIYLGPNDIQMGKRESASDVGIVTSSMADLIMARTFSHQTVEELATGSTVPVINGLSDLEHPCQILADFLTIQESLGTVSGLKIVFLGDGNNNVTHSLALMSAMLGNHFVIAAPKGYEMDKGIAVECQAWAKKNKVKFTQTTDPQEAAKGADVVVTDTWVSMGDETETNKRLKVFPPYQVTPALMRLANKKAIFMHCLPAYREKEVASAVIDGPQSVVFQEAENRLHAQKGLMVWLLQK